MKLVLLIVLLCGVMKNIENAKILALFPLPVSSHFLMFKRILKGLAETGHNVDVVSHFPLKKPTPRYNDISLVGTQPIFNSSVSIDDWRVSTRLHDLYLWFTETGYETCEATFKSEAVKNLRNSTKKYDLVIAELFATDCMLGFGYHFKVPTVVLTSSVALPWGNDRFGNPDNPAYIPTFEAQFSTRMSLYQRIINTWYLITTQLTHYILSGILSNVAAKRFFGPDLPDLESLAYNTSLVLVNSHYSMNHARPTVPNFIEVGGVHIADPAPLSKYFEDLLKTEAEGVIYLSVGSMIMTESFPVEKLQGMFDAFAQLPYKVIWKADKAKFSKQLKFPKNIHFEKWMPQLDILCHPNVKLFVSHGGLMGSQEAVYCGVPRLGIPLFADQELNVRQSESLGLGIRVSYDNITKQSILEAASELLYNPKYKETAEITSKMFKDRPMSPLDTALYWIEYIIRYKGAPHLRSAGAELYWFQYHLLDVIIIYITVILITIYLMYVTFKLLCNLKTGKRKSE